MREEGTCTGKNCPDRIAGIYSVTIFDLEIPFGGIPFLDNLDTSFWWDMSTVPLSNIDGHAPVLMGALAKQMVRSRNYGNPP